MSYISLLYAICQLVILIIKRHFSSKQLFVSNFSPKLINTAALERNKTSLILSIFDKYVPKTKE